MRDNYDPLALRRPRVRGCAQCFRRLGRGEITFADLEENLAGVGCRGKGCEDCVEAGLRLADYYGYQCEYMEAVHVARWAKRCSGLLSPDYQLRAASSCAFFQRYDDSASATQQLGAAAVLLDNATPAERAHHLARSALVLTESLLFSDARRAVIRSRELYQNHSPADPERGPAWWSIADTYVEIGAAYADADPRFEEPLHSALDAWVRTPESLAPRTYHALVANILTLLVSAWRSGISGIDPAPILEIVESSFDFRTRRSDATATSMRWLWVVIAAQNEGMSQAVRNRLRATRSGLISQQRWRDLLYFELDVLWASCYHRRRPLRSHLRAQARNLRRAFEENGQNSALIDDFELTAASSPYLARELLVSLFKLRGLGSIRLRDVCLD